MNAGGSAAHGGRVRLLVVTHSLSGGGAERFASTLLGALDRRRFAPEACLVAERATTYDLPEDVPENRLGYRGAADLPRTVLRLRRLLAAGGFDLVLSNVLKTNALTGAALAGLVGPPRWAARVGLAPGRGDAAWARAGARAVYPWAAVLVANSERMAAAFAERHPRLALRVRHLPNPTDFARLDELAAEEPSGAIAAPLAEFGGGPLLVAVGRLNRQKRPDLALEVLARVRDRVDARLVWCGDGPLRPAVERRAADLGLAAAARFPGFVANPFPLLRRADLFLLTSDFEGLPNALIEAQGLGLPAVATRCPHGPDEIVEDGATGLLAPTGDAEEVAAAAADLLADPARRRRMGEAAAARARRLYDAAVLVPAWERLLLAAAGRSVSNSVQ
jgi:N-acetylgalactosamine-N,N'-diacetylbacillosaminyl-diphospho-undecaprenol 4-alpha-N-acetylgalactosaminyltransferase